MQTLDTTILLKELEEKSISILQYIDQLTKQSDEAALKKSAPGKWNTIQVLDHLNSYYDFYLPAIANAMNQKITTPSKNFKPGWIGNYFTKLMEPNSDGKLKSKMKAPKNHRPANDLNIDIVVNKFRENQQQFIALLKKATNSNIGEIRVPISLTKLIKLKLGDVFRFIVAHNIRHQLQIANTIYPSLQMNAKLAF